MVKEREHALSIFLSRKDGQAVEEGVFGVWNTEIRLAWTFFWIFIFLPLMWNIMIRRKKG